MAPTHFKTVLIHLHEAGGSRVPADTIAWTPDMVPAINFALSMQYMVYRETRDGRIYSLTDAGLKAIGLPPRRLSLIGAFRLAFGLKG
jgi:hypothetical protein